MYNVKKMTILKIISISNNQVKKKQENKLTAVLPKTTSKSLIEEKTAVLDKLRTEIERQRSVHDDRDSSSEIYFI